MKTIEDAARDEANQSPSSGVTNVNKSDSWINIIGPWGRGEEVGVREENRERLTKNRNTIA